ncbi:interleukin-6 [Castor canadensis]|uniref:Interleukin-6 n=1 Tax=Castor canadensis TaxID=51338 RepID=A0AC58LVW0_CASCN
MKFHSKSTFCPLAFLGLLLVTATAFPTSEVLREDFTDDANQNRPTHASSQKIEDQISYILKEILELRKELCGNDENCLNNEEAVSENKLNLPMMTLKDGCFQTGYNRDTCILKVTSGLLEFQIYLEYIHNTFQDNEKKNRIRDVQSNTKSLIQNLKQQVKNPDKIVFPSPTANATLLEKLQSQNNWQKTMTINIILRSLEDFLQFSLRALRKP